MGPSRLAGGSRPGSTCVSANGRSARSSIAPAERGAPRSRRVHRPADSAPPVVDRNELRAGGDGAGLGDRRPRCERSDPAVIIWTSGTTGVPKGAWFDHRNLDAAVASAGVMSDAVRRQARRHAVPHAGYMAKLWDQLAWGTTIVIAPAPWRASDMLRLLVEERITVAGGAPTQWAKLLDEPGLADADLVAGAPRAGRDGAGASGADRAGRPRDRVPARGALRDDRVAEHHRHRTGRRPAVQCRPSADRSAAWRSRSSTDDGAAVPPATWGGCASVAPA